MILNTTGFERVPFHRKGYIGENAYFCIYCDGALFGLICDNNFYLKVTIPALPKLKAKKNPMK